MIPLDWERGRGGGWKDGIPKEDRECMGWAKDNGDTVSLKGSLKPYHHCPIHKSSFKGLLKVVKIKKCPIKCQESYRISTCKLRIKDLDKCIIIISPLMISQKSPSVTYLRSDSAVITAVLTDDPVGPRCPLQKRPHRHAEAAMHQYSVLYWFPTLWES